MTVATGGVIEVARGSSARVAQRWLRGGDLHTAQRTYSYHPPALPAGEELNAPDVSPAEAAQTALIAAQAQAQWAAVPAFQRAGFVREIALAIEERREELAAAVMIDSGKPIAHARAEVAFCLRVIDTLLASVAELGAPSRTDYLTGQRVVTQLRPVGPALLMTPWNFPLNLGMRKIATALLAGCTVVWKPSDRAPLAAMILAEAIAEIDFPPGVVSVLPTSDSVAVVDALISSGHIRKLSFTGSTEVGKTLMAQAADQLLRTSFELGGNGPAIVAPSADVATVVDAVMRAKFTGNGQVCTTINRLYVARDLAPQLIQALRDRMDAMKVGWPDDPEVDLGPVLSDASKERITGIVDRARASGATVTTHGTQTRTDGSFIAPTLVLDVATNDEICQQELFGPVLPVVVYDDLDDAISQANATPFGLASYVFGDSATEVERMLAGVSSGLIAVNSSSPSSVSTPFGGIGWSGIGRENGVRGLMEFLDEISYVY